MVACDGLVFCVCVSSTKRNRQEMVSGEEGVIENEAFADEEENEEEELQMFTVGVL